MDCRKYVLSIAGFDPSAGAGVLADLKCFEQHQVYGFGICSALTVQTDDSFLAVEWLDADQIIAQLAPLLRKFKVAAVKIGLIKDLKTLETIVDFIKTIDISIKLVLDPVLSSSSGFEFHQWSSNEIGGILRKLDLITPNYEEMKRMGENGLVEHAATKWAIHCPVLLKGGHHPLFPGRDQLFETLNSIISFDPPAGQCHPKHGSGCVLSAAITANLAQGDSLAEACRKAKNYTAAFLNSNTSLLGYHSSVGSLPSTVDYQHALMNK